MNITIYLSRYVEGKREATTVTQTGSCLSTDWDSTELFRLVGDGWKIVGHKDEA